MFIETPLYEAGQVLSLASAALANAALGSEFYLQEINDVHSTLRTLSRYEFMLYPSTSSDTFRTRFWATASFKVASFSVGEQHYNGTF